MSRTITLVPVLAALLLLAPRVLAQHCPGQWLDGPDQGAPGVVGAIYAACLWDADGPGGRPPLLVVGGRFIVAGHAFATNVAAYDGTNWQPLGEGTDNYVWSLTEYNGDLIAGGSFSTAGGAPAANIARWDGHAWRPLGQGLTGPRGFTHVSALTVYEGELVAGGDFTAAGGAPAASVARWDGQAWHTMGAGMSAGNVGVGCAYVTCFTQFNGDLIAAGCFNFAGSVGAHSIARWNGQDWYTVGDGLWGARVHSAVVYNGELLAFGEDMPYGGSVVRLAQGVWHPFHNSPPEAVPVTSVTVHNGELFAAGNSGSVHGDFNAVVRFAGPAWEQVGAALPLGIGVLIAYEGELFACGNTIARWNGSSWRPLGSGVDGAINSLTTYNGALVIGGNFAVAGDAWANSIASWDGRRWSALGTGMAGPSPIVSSMLTNRGDLIAAGYFDTAGGANARCIARWDGQAWHAMGTPTFLEIQSIVEFRGQLLAAGRVFSGTSAINHVTAWDGSEWRPFDNDLDPYGEVRSLLIYRGDLYAAGEFAAPDGSDRVPRPRVARRDGQRWTAVGERLAANGEARVLAVHQGDLILGGAFGVVRWDGHAWTPLGSGLDFGVYSLASYGDALFAGGADSPPDGLGNVARWDGASWLPLQGGTTYTPAYGSAVFALQEYRGQLIAGGGFRGMGGRVSVNWARWSRASCDFDNDGAEGTDQDIELFLRCLAGDCCPTCGSPDFDGDGDAATDADIESFFRVLAGGAC
jgi:hypothetical protein